MTTPRIVDVRFEHYPPSKPALGVHDTAPRISWRFADVKPDFTQSEYEIEITRFVGHGSATVTAARVVSGESYLVPWPYHDRPLVSRERCSVRVRIHPWSAPAELEAGLLQREKWTASLITAPWSNTSGPLPEDLFRNEFTTPDLSRAHSARLYITALGVYEAELNGVRVGDQFMAPGLTSYGGQLHYQTYDVTALLKAASNRLVVRVAEGWYKGRIGFADARGFYGSRTALLAQLEVSFKDGSLFTMGTDGTWTAAQGPIRRTEMYDGEVYDARVEAGPGDWRNVQLLPPLPTELKLVSGSKPPVRRLETVKPIKTIKTPLGRTVLDFGQNLVGHLRVKNIRAPVGHMIILQHAEVLENGELGLRPLRTCQAQDTYIARGDAEGETYQPRFTYHGFRYAQIDGWPTAGTEDITQSVEAVVCNSDMEEAGSFSCSNNRVNQLFSNTKWSMRGNFFSLPTDCPQRDERLGWTGDLALFAPTATLIYNCSGVLKDWLQDVSFDQQRRGGVPPMVSPNVLEGVPIWGEIWPCAVWHDVVVLAPWALWEETGDVTILEQQYESMKSWLDAIPRNKDRLAYLWDLKAHQLGDWLDPYAPPDDPQKALTDPTLVANAFLAHCLALMAQVSTMINRSDDAQYSSEWSTNACKQFTSEYVTPSGRLTSDTQTAYALAICFNLLPAGQIATAGIRLAEIVTGNNHHIGTGFAGTPYLAEALARTGHTATAYALLLNETCPSWLYPISMGATTIWERWDSMRPDGTINPGEMTSFNHYAFGAVSKFLVERVAGLQRLSPGWKKARAQPLLGGGFTRAAASHLTPYGVVSVAWRVEGLGDRDSDSDEMRLTMRVVVPPMTTMEVVIPSVRGDDVKVLGSGRWSFSSLVRRGMLA
ncbi:hypothetical protein BDW74DRAFT_189187 [Aspergillus multicolor]|uniref:uncharacterized protein n=1 Tax=Aspergillus multicolor TaxID=41759 RepID=UPI003CCE258A